MKVRMRFSKAGTMKFIGHLDVMRYFQKAFRRAELDMIYSQGYSPHPLLSFASPLGVGLTSDGEYLDIQLHTCGSSQEMIERINQVMTPEIRIESVKLLPDDSKTSMALVAGADYLVSLKDGYETIPELDRKFTEFLAQDVIEVTKKTKTGETVMDIRPWIYETAFTPEAFCEKTGRNPEPTVAEAYGNGQRIYMRLSAGSSVNIKPELVLSAFYDWLGKEMSDFSWQIHRIEMYAAGAEGGFVALDDLGEDL